MSTELRLCSVHEAGHCLVAMLAGIPILGYRVHPTGKGNVRLAPHRACVDIPVAGLVAEGLERNSPDDWHSFAARNPRMPDVVNARAGAVAVGASDVEAACAAAWRTVRAAFEQPHYQRALEAIAALSVERWTRVASADDRLTPADVVALAAIVAPLTPHQIAPARKNTDTKLTFSGTITPSQESLMSMSPTDIAAAARGLDRRIHPSHAPVIATALKRAGRRGEGAVDSLVDCLNVVARTGGFDHPRVEAPASHHVELSAPSRHRAATAHARRSAPSSEREDAKFAALSGVDVATFREHREQLAAVDDEEREAAHEDASQSDARRAERLCAASVGLDLGAFRAACEHVGGLEPHQGGAVGFTLEQLGGVPSNGKKGNPASDDADSGDEGSGNADDDDGDEDADSEAEKKALRTARALGWSGSGKEFLRAWRADRAAARNG